jgi:hypothetical protein
MLQDEQVASAGDANADTARAKPAAMKVVFMACILKSIEPAWMR